jgi:hypothetical protein
MIARLCFGLAYLVVSSCASDTMRPGQGLELAAPGPRPLSAAEAAGSAPPGFTEAVARAHAQLVDATPGDLARRAPAFQTPLPVYLDSVQYLDRILKPVTHGQPSKHYALNEQERATLSKHLFVASERLGDLTYAGLYHRIYEHDQPVFITADSVLHAFHMSYDAMLAQLETEYLIGAVDGVLAGMARRVTAAQSAHDGDALAPAVGDADVFVAVGRSLLAGKDVPTIIAANHDRARAILEAIAELRPKEIKLFGYQRSEDFSQLRPRGHYTKSDELERYFRAMMWLGRTELRVAGKGVPPAELAGAIVLHELLARSAALPRWQQIDELIQTFVGPADAMSVGQLDALLSTRQMGRALQHAELKGLQDHIARTKLGEQAINSQLRVADADKTVPTPLPSAFSFFPQRFTVDSWVLSQLVFDRARYQGVPVEREIPSGVDVAFAALGNDGAARILAERIEDQQGVDGRDGLPIQASLLATRAVIDARPSAAWDANLYEGWISALRALSEPTTDARYPSVMRSEAWSNRRLQTQLASWSELRHDTILYVKQSYAMVTCEYPAGFVELQPAFWQRLEHAAKLASGALERIELPQERTWLKAAQLEHWASFASTIAKLRGIAVKELAAEPLEPSELQFLKEAIEVPEIGGCGERPAWSGWYVKLYYGGSRDALEWDALAADVHTSPKEGVLTVATGGVDLMVAIIDRGEHTMAFAGPTAQYWELVASDGARMTNLEWKQKLKDGRAPPRPEWTSQWLVSGKAPYQSHPR